MNAVDRGTVPSIQGMCTVWYTRWDKFEIIVGSLAAICERGTHETRNGTACPRHVTQCRRYVKTWHSIHMLWSRNHWLLFSMETIFILQVHDSNSVFRLAFRIDTMCQYQGGSLISGPLQRSGSEHILCKFARPLRIGIRICNDIVIYASSASVTDYKHEIVSRHFDP